MCKLLLGQESKKPGRVLKEKGEDELEGAGAGVGGGTQEE